MCALLIITVKLEKEPRFANTESSGVIVNAVEHPQLAANLGGSVTPKGRARSRRATGLQTPPEVDTVTATTPPPVKHCECCQHSAQPGSGNGMVTPPAKVQEYCENHSELCFLPSTSPGLAATQNYMVTQHRIPKPIIQQIDPTLSSKKSSCCTASSAKFPPTPLHHITPSHLSNTSFPLDSPSTLILSPQPPLQSYNNNNNAPINPTWDIFPVVNALYPDTLDGCCCVDETSCLCEGCRDHPRNPATLQMVNEALDYQAQETYIDFGGDVGDATAEQPFLYSDLPTQPFLDPPYSQPEAIFQGQRFGCCGAGGFTAPSPLPLTPPIHMQHLHSHSQHLYEPQQLHHHTHATEDVHPVPPQNIDFLDPPLLAKPPTVWSQTRASQNPGLFDV